MEQTLARHGERLDDHDREIKDIKGRLENTENSVTALDKDIAIILNDGSHTRDAIAEMKSGMKTGLDDLKKDIAELRKHREDDHFVKPIAKHEQRGEKIWWAVVGGGITALVGAAMAALITLL